MTIKEKITAAALVIMAATTCYTAYQVQKLSSFLNDSSVLLNQKVESVAVDTEGRLRQLDEKYARLAEVKNTAIIQKEIQYVKKESEQDADIELNSRKAPLTVRVNGGNAFSFYPLEGEAAKLTDGKLVITSTYAANLDVTAPKKSRWEVTTAMNSDKKVLGGLGYRLGNSLQANIYAGQGIKPYYGLTWSVGSSR